MVRFCHCPFAVPYPQFAIRNSPLAKSKKEMERRQTLYPTSRAAGHGRASQQGCARLSASHRGSCQRDSWSPRLCTRPRFPGSVRSARSYGPPTGAKIVRVSTGVTRAVLSPSSEHLTHRSLCRQSDARCRPSAEATKPLPAGTAIPLPPAIRHPADALARGVRGRRF